MSILYPTVIDDVGQVVDPRSDDYIEGHEPGQAQAYATVGLPPLGWNRGQPDSSRQVGWTLHRGGRIIAQHAFSINPQAITRTASSRNQLFATQAAFYVDDFGPGAETIQLTQLVAHGRSTTGGGGQLTRATMREDVLRFYDQIYTQAVENPGVVTVYFHDNHLWNQINGRSPELVYFPGQQGFQLVRSVQLHNTWQVQVTMVTLTPANAASRSGSPTPGQPRIKVHIVRHGETLKKIAARLAGRNNTHKRVLQLEHQIIALTRKYGQDDITKNRTVPIYSATDPQQWVLTLHVKRMHLAVGEKIILPAG